MTARHHVVVLLFPGVTLLDVSGPAEVFAAANSAGADYAVRFVSPSGGDVETSVGARIATESLADLEGAPRIGTLLVAGGESLATRPVPDGVVTAVRAVADHSDRVASVCTGAFALAEAGLLDGRRATTHWRHAAELARRYPVVTVHPDELYVRDGAVFTSAGISSGIDLALSLVAVDHGRNLAHGVARELVVYMQRAGGQSQFSAALDWPAPSSAPLRELCADIVSDPAAAPPVAELARRAHMSVRHLSRLFTAELGVSPGKFVEQVRVETARSLLDRGHGVMDTARLSGFGTDETLRRAFVRHFGVTPSYYRGRFPTDPVREPYRSTTSNSSSDAPVATGLR